jgi:hypothetical protein
VVIQWLGWDVYQTFFVPDATLLLMLAATIALPVLGWWGRGRSA